MPKKRIVVNWCKTFNLYSISIQFLEYSSIWEEMIVLIFKFRSEIQPLSTAYLCETFLEAVP